MINVRLVVLLRPSEKNKTPIHAGSSAHMYRDTKKLTFIYWNLPCAVQIARPYMSSFGNKLNPPRFTLIDVKLSIFHFASDPDDETPQQHSQDDDKPRSHRTVLRPNDGKTTKKVQINVSL